MRKIIHLDMDCFYAAVELRERPELVGKPVAVGGGSKRGVICTCNYEARAFGVRSAMPGFLARQRCPELIFLPVRFDLYRADSKRIQAILRDYTEMIEPLSLDEAYLDVTASGRFAWDIAKEIRARIRAETGLTASAGVAPNKLLAKIASDWRKPNGQFAILPEQALEFMAALPVRKVHGIGPKTAERLARHGIETCGDLQQHSLSELTRLVGSWGPELYRLCRGEDDRSVHPHRVRKSFSNENTFSENLTTLAQCEDQLAVLTEELLTDLRQKAPDRRIHKAQVTVKFSDFTRTTKECVCPEPNLEVYRTLLAAAHARRPLPVRLLGVGVRFVEEDEPAAVQAELFA